MPAFLLKLYLSVWGQRLWILFCKIWWVIPICILCGLFLYWVYMKGYNKADGMWLADTTTKVTALNTKIIGLETSSKIEADGLRAANTELQKRMEAIILATPKMVAKNVNGTTLMCGSVPVGTVYLGQDFTDSWNALNDAGAAK